MREQVYALISTQNIVKTLELLTFLIKYFLEYLKH
jgi:hypothetical protein